MMRELANNLTAATAYSLNEQRILLLVPTGKDARLTQTFLSEAGLDCVICPNIAAVCVGLDEDAGLLVIAEEMLNGEGMIQLQAALARQPAWSDVPIIVMTSGGASSSVSAYALENLGNVMLLDRPVHIAILVSTVQTALRARTRQYQIRAYVREREQYSQERERLYAAEQQARAEAEAALHIRDEFLSIAAHELKTPLTTLMGNLDLIQRRARREGGLSERDARAIGIASQQARRLKQMIDSLLDLSRLELGQLSIEPKPLDLAQLARRVVSEVQPGLSHHSIICHTSSAPVMIAGDEVRLEQVLQNLLQNAVRYSPNGGMIEVGVATDERAALASLQVRDQGIGIAASALSKLFERFYRVPDTSIEHIHGVGIGLHVVKEIVTLHGGAVEVASEAGVGSTFTVNLPLQPLAQEYANAAGGSG